MDGWMDGWLGGWMDGGWVGGWMDGGPITLRVSGEGKGGGWGEVCISCMLLTLIETISLFFVALKISHISLTACH